MAIELATIASAAGAEVSIIHHNDRPLKAFDEELVAELMNQLKTQGLSLNYDISLDEIEKTESETYLLKGNKFQLESDLVICATGRIPNVETLQLENAGVQYDQHGIIVNEFLQTTTQNIFACGDVLAKKNTQIDTSVYL